MSEKPSKPGKSIQVFRTGSPALDKPSSALDKPSSALERTAPAIADDMGTIV
jgi:hypothetical protein